MARQNSNSNKPGSCLCGCGGETKPRRRFLQGHDQRLRGMLQRGEVTANTAALRAFVAENRETTKRKPAKASKPAAAPEATEPEATEATEPEAAAPAE